MGASYPAGSAVKTINRGIAIIADGTSFTDVTVTAVSTTKCAVIFGGFISGSPTAVGTIAEKSIFPYGNLTSTTNLRLSMGGNPDAGSNTTVSYSLVEFL